MVQLWPIKSLLFPSTAVLSPACCPESSHLSTSWPSVVPLVLGYVTSRHRSKGLITLTSTTRRSAHLTNQRENSSFREKRGTVWGTSYLFFLSVHPCTAPMQHALNVVWTYSLASTCYLKCSAVVEGLYCIYGWRQWVKKYSIECTIESYKLSKNKWMQKRKSFLSMCSANQPRGYIYIYVYTV